MEANDRNDSVNTEKNLKHQVIQRDFCVKFFSLD